MKILITQTVHGSLDGLTVQELLAGREYDTAATRRGDSLARYHIKRGVAVVAPAPAVRLARPARKPRVVK